MRPRERRGPAGHPTDLEVTSAGSYALAAIDLVAVFDGRRVLDGVTLPVVRGRITVLVGASGVGKTTCIRHMVGLAAPASGRVLIEGRDVGQASTQELRELRARMSVMLQGSSLFGSGLFGSSSLFDNVAFPLRARESLSEAEIARLVRRALEDVGLAHRAHASIGELSAGMAQRASLARALVSGSEIVVLDGLDSGIDPARKQAVTETIRRAHAASGATFLVTTHDADQAKDLADVLAVMRRGRIEALGPANQVLADGASFATRFMAGDAASGLGMADELGEDAPRRAPRAEAREVSDRRATAVGAAIVIVIAVVLIGVLLAGILFLGVPTAPP